MIERRPLFAEVNVRCSGNHVFSLFSGRGNCSSRKTEVEKHVSPWQGEISLGARTRPGASRERERARAARSSWVPHRHNTSHYVIRASLDTAIYHSSARTPIYRSSPYACKTLLLPLPPSPPLGPALLFVYEPRRKEGARSRAENNRGGDRGNDISLMNIVSREWGKTRIREIDI